MLDIVVVSELQAKSIHANPILLPLVATVFPCVAIIPVACKSTLPVDSIFILPLVPKAASVISVDAWDAPCFGLWPEDIVTVLEFISVLPF